MTKIDERCKECGADLRLGPDSCPLCGARVAPPREADAPGDVDLYQSNVRRLRGELARLRGEGLRAS